MPKTRDWKTQATCTTNEQLDGWKEENIHLYVHLKTEPGSKWVNDIYSCKHSSLNRKNYNCPAVMRIRKKSDLSVTYVQTIYEHGDHLPINDNGLSEQMKEEIQRHKQKTPEQIRKEIQSTQKTPFSALQVLKIPTLKQIKNYKTWLGIQEGFTAALSLDDVQKMYEEHKDIPQNEDEPYCSGFGKQEVPVKDGDKEWQFYLIFTTKRLMKLQHLSFILQVDATYKLNLVGYPVLVSASFS
uniref:FLYWCH-type domain-containing protein n=1 Tax=Ditylenchus dipsaci TaxID=166011 RepID=A0A915DYE7_9BILA